MIALPAPAGFAAGSTTRLLAHDDLPVNDALRRLASALGAPGAVTIRARQVHGRDVRIAESIAPAPGEDLVLGDADAVLTDRRGVLVAVVTADCVPLVLVDEVSGWMAAVHAGWRGTAARIVDAVLDAFVDRGVPAERLVASFGPSIGRDSYEVGPEVVQALAASGDSAGAAVSPGRGDRSYVDVAAFNEAALRRRGVRTIHVSTHDTYADPVRFPSYRRDGARTGRIVTGVIRL